MASFQGLSEKSMLSILSIFLICTSTCQVCFSAVGPDLVVVDFWELNHLVYFKIKNIGDQPAQAGHATTSGTTSHEFQRQAGQLLSNITNFYELRA